MNSGLVCRRSWDFTWSDNIDNIKQPLLGQVLLSIISVKKVVWTVPRKVFKNNKQR